MLTVDAAGRGQYQEIADAVHAAPPGALILVAAGQYTKKVTVDKPIELRGLGPLGATTLTAGNGHALRLNVEHAVVRNLAVIGVGKYWGDTEALRIVKGSPWIIGCDISCKSHACVQIEGHARPTLVGCTIRNGKTSGVYATDNSVVRIEAGLIYGHAKYGVELRGKAQMTVRHAAVYGNQKSGLYIHGKARGDVQACEIYDNRDAGLAVTEDAQALVIHSSFRNNTKRGLLIANNAVANLDTCHIYRNTGPGIELKDRAAPEVFRTAVTDNTGPGVQRHGTKVAGQFLGIDLQGNAGGAIDHPGDQNDVPTFP